MIKCITKCVTGYEEPENGIEFLSCYGMAQELYSYSEDCQLLVTTHSPAFYSLNNEINTKCFYVSKSSKGNSQYDMTYEADEIDRKIGLMPLVIPYITSEHDKFLKERIVLEEKIQEIELKYRQMSGKIILITEGKTDKKHIKNAFQYLNLGGEFLERPEYAYSAKTAHPFLWNGALFRLKLSGAQLVD